MLLKYELPPLAVSLSVEELGTTLGGCEGHDGVSDITLWVSLDALLYFSICLSNECRIAFLK